MSAWNGKTSGGTLAPSADILVTNGLKGVTLGIDTSDGRGTLTSLTPGESRELAIALLNAARNVRLGAWGGPQYTDNDHAHNEIGY